MEVHANVCSFIQEVWHYVPPQGQAIRVDVHERACSTRPGRHFHFRLPATRNAGNWSVDGLQPAVLAGGGLALGHATASRDSKLALSVSASNSSCSRRLGLLDPAFAVRSNTHMIHCGRTSFLCGLDLVSLPALRHRFSLKSKAKQPGHPLLSEPSESETEDFQMSQRGCYHLPASVHNCILSLRTCLA